MWIANNRNDGGEGGGEGASIRLQRENPAQFALTVLLATGQLREQQARGKADGAARTLNCKEKEELHVKEGHTTADETVGPVWRSIQTWRLRG